jgi:lysophospholipase L1-like esterase
MGKPVHFRYPQPRYVHDAEIGHWLEPNQRSFTHDKPVFVNSVGIRGPEYSRQSPPDTPRILAIGDSQTFGNGLALPDTWPAQLEQELDRLGQGRWEVLNGGVPSTDTWQHVHVLRRLANAYSFDGVALAFYVNDVTRPWEAGPAQERTNTWLKRTGYVLKRSALLALIWQTYQGLTTAGNVNERERRILTGQPSPAVERGWDEVERSLAEIVQLTEELGTGLLLIVLPRRDQVNGREDAKAYNERIAAIASRLGIGSIDVLPDLREAYARDGDALFIPWDGHNASLANAVIAQVLVRPAVTAFAPTLSESRRTGRAGGGDSAAPLPDGSMR